MRTTVTLAPDVAAEVERLRREHGISMSDAISTLARRGMIERPAGQPYRIKPVSMGVMIDISRIGDVLALLDELDAAEHADRCITDRD